MPGHQAPPRYVRQAHSASNVLDIPCYLDLGCATGRIGGGAPCARALQYFLRSLPDVIGATWHKLGHLGQGSMVCAAKLSVCPWPEPRYCTLPAVQSMPFRTGVVVGGEAIHWRYSSLPLSQETGLVTWLTEADDCARMYQLF